METKQGAPRRAAGVRWQCIQCGERLRAYPWRATEWARAAGKFPAGARGDGVFCGVTCGYRFALTQPAAIALQAERRASLARREGGAS